MSELYRVPKREVAAEVILLGQAAAQVKLFLSERAETHLGAERPSDLFSGAGAFIPAVDPAGGPVLLQRDAVMVVSVSAEEEFGGDGQRAEDLAADQATKIEVEVVLQDGNKARGTLTYIRPDGQRRLQDFLNQSDPFLALREAGKARLINKRRIAKISAVKPA